jgi:predicted dehydrogenase
VTTSLVGASDPDHVAENLAAGTFDPMGADAFDAVVIATPAKTHAALTIESLKMGLHVLVEKPLATNLKDAVQIAEAEKDSLAKVMVGHTFLYSAPVRHLQALLREGGIGEVNYLYSQRLSLGRIRTDCNALWNFGPHDVSIALNILQMEPTAAQATGFSVLGSGVYDVMFGTVIFDDKIPFHMHLSWLDPRKIRQMTVVGSDRMLVYDDVSIDAPLAIYESAIERIESFSQYGDFAEFQWKTRPGDVRLPKLARPEPLAEEMKAFAKLCVGESEPPTGISHAMMVTRTLSAMTQSVDAGGVYVGL